MMVWLADQAIYSSSVFFEQALLIKSKENPNPEKWLLKQSREMILEEIRANNWQRNQGEMIVKEIMRDDFKEYWWDNC